MVMNPQTDFESVVARAKDLGRRPDITDFVARAKWDAWATLAGVPPAKAMRDYIALVDTLQDAA